MGYRIQNGRAEIIQEEAELVKRIFADYLNGAATYRIAKTLAEHGVSNANGDTNWYHGSVGNLLKNPKYCGDGFYPAIISQELYQKVQERRNERTRKLGRNYYLNYYKSKGIFYERVFCGECGQEYRKYAKRRQKAGEDKWCWNCSKYQNGRKVSCGNRIRSEEQIKNAALTAMNLVAERPELAQAVPEENITVETPAYRKRTRQIEELLQMDTFSVEEIKTLLYERAEEQYRSMEIRSQSYYAEQMEEILCRRGRLEQFDELCFEKTVEKIMVFKNGTMDVHMRNGIIIQIEENGEEESRDAGKRKKEYIGNTSKASL